ncbi:hypothetical protein PQX77_011183 [Marasmius sp. AFHP31]|nr:hypothetical protein PQX77_011183 [Marasmius sp. AFHP31]
MGDQYATIGRYVEDDNQNVIQQPGLGTAPIKAVIQKVIELLVANRNYFIGKDEFRIWAFKTESSHKRVVFGKTLETFMALHLQWLGYTAHPIPPVIYLIVIKDFNFCMDISHLQTY